MIAPAEGEPLFLGAPDRAGWIRLASSLLDWIAADTGEGIADVAGTLNAKLPSFRFRVGMSVQNLGGLSEALRAAIERLDSGADALLGEAGAFHWPGESARWGWLRRGGPAWDWSRWGLRPDWQADANDRDRLSRDLQGVGCATWVLTGMESPRGAWQEGGAVAIEVGSPPEALAALYARGVPIDLAPWYAARGARTVDFARPARPSTPDHAARLRDLADALRRARSLHSSVAPAPAAAEIDDDRPRRIALRADRFATLDTLIRLLIDSPGSIPDEANRLAEIEIRRIPGADNGLVELDRIETPLATWAGRRVTLRDRSEVITAIASRGDAPRDDNCPDLVNDQGAGEALPAALLETADDPETSPRWKRAEVRPLADAGLILTAESEGAAPPAEAAIALLQRAGACWSAHRQGPSSTSRLARIEELAWAPGREPSAPGLLALAVRFSRDGAAPDEFRADADLRAPDGSLLATVRGADFLTTRWPFAIRAALRDPERSRIGEPLPLPPNSGAAAIWLESPEPPAPSHWESALEAAWLAEDEREAIRDAGGPPLRRRQRARGRIAAKEAALQLWQSRGGIPIAPLGLHTWSDERGRPHLRVRPPHALSNPPAIGIAHQGRVSVALAASQPWTHAGIDLETIAPRPPGFEALAFAENERAILDQSPCRDEWSARLWCAKEAAAKATGWGAVAGPASALAIAADPTTGLITLRLGEALASYCPRLAGRDLVAHTDRRGDLAWGWVLCREGRP